MKRWIIIFALIFALLLGSCAPEPAAEDAAPVEEAAPAEEAEEVEQPAEEAMEPVALRFTYYADGNEADVMQVLVDAFMAENPAITVVLDVVPYATIDEQLPVQVETGEGPDLARITNFGAYSGKLLDLRDYLGDVAFYEENFPAPILSALGYGGYPDAFTVTGPYVNLTLFEQAEIDLPAADASWEDWTAATKAVAEATGVQYAISVDRTGHRYAGPALSMGATLIDAEGNFVVTDPGFSAYAELIKGWHD